MIDYWDWDVSLLHAFVDLFDSQPVVRALLFGQSCGVVNQGSNSDMVKDLEATVAAATDECLCIDLLGGCVRV